MDLLSYLRTLRQRWMLIVVLTVVGAIIGAASSQIGDNGSSGSSRTYYKATNTLLLGATAPQSGFQPTFTNLPQVALLTTTGDVPAAAATALGVSESPLKLAERIFTTVDQSTSTLAITAAQPSPSLAARTANEFGEQLIASLTQRDLDSYNARRDLLNTRVENLTRNVSQLTSQLAASPSDRVVAAQLNTAQNALGGALTDFGNLTAIGPPAARLQSLESAQAVPIDVSEYDAIRNLGALHQNHLEASADTSSPTVVASSSGASVDGPVARGLIGGMLGLLIGVGIALLLERLNRRVRTHIDAEAAFGLPVLAEVPELKRAEQRDHMIVAADAPLSRAAEAYRAVRSSLLFSRALTAPGDGSRVNLTGANGGPDLDAHGEPFVVMVTSARPAEGKTTCTANLAAVFAEAGASVLAVNCDFRRPALHEFFGLTDEPRRVHSTSLHGVKVVTNVLTDPAANPSQVVAAQRQVIAAARGRFDLILLDTAPLLTANDAAELVGSADVVILMARAERTRFDSAERATELLNRLDAPLGGVVLSGTRAASNDYYYYYQAGRLPDPGTLAKRGPVPLRPPTANGAASTDDDVFGDEKKVPTKRSQGA